VKLRKARKIVRRWSQVHTDSPGKYVFGLASYPYTSSTLDAAFDSWGRHLKGTRGRLLPVGRELGLGVSAVTDRKENCVV
jgi:hypothetical protein